MRFRPRLCNVLLWGILYGYTETAQVALMQPAIEEFGGELCFPERVD